MRSHVQILVDFEGDVINQELEAMCFDIEEIIRNGDSYDATNIDADVVLYEEV